MQLLSKLEKRFGRFAISNLTTYLIFAQVAMYLLLMGRNQVVDRLLFYPNLFLAGEVWRILTVLIIPPLSNPLFAFFFWYLFYLMGNALESTWGAFRYNVYLLVGYVATVAVAFVTPDLPAQNGFLYGSVFLAFAYLFPDFELAIFFILPVKIKWLALITWLFYAVRLVGGDWAERLAVVAAVLNFLLFFTGEILGRARAGHRRAVYEAQEAAQRERPFHECRVCGLTEKIDPKAEFRYCSQCAGSCCYCMEHLRNHEHVQPSSAS